MYLLASLTSIVRQNINKPKTVIEATVMKHTKKNCNIAKVQRKSKHVKDK